MPARKRIPVEERFWSKVDKSGRCWVWTANRSNAGYGLFCLREDKTVSAHRMAYSLTHGEIPSGMHVCHHCDNPPCVNPDHLFLGTHQDNMRDMFAKGRHRYGSGGGPRTHCPQGHEYSEQNTRYRTDRDGYRYRVCKECQKADARKRCVAVRHRMKDSCINGHPRTPENQYWYGKTVRRWHCRSCMESRGQLRPLSSSLPA